MTSQIVHLTPVENMENMPAVEGETTTDNQEIIIDGMPLQIPAGNYKTEVLEDGTVQVIVYQDHLYQTTDSSLVQSESAIQTNIELRNRRAHDIGIQNTTVPHFNSYSFSERGIQTESTDDDIDPNIENLQDVKNILPTDVDEKVVVKQGRNKGRIAQNARVIHNLNMEDENRIRTFGKGGREITYHKCGICGKVYKNKTNWQTHLKTHAREDVFMCGFCGQIFQKSAFPQHLKSHKKEVDEEKTKNSGFNGNLNGDVTEPLQSALPTKPTEAIQPSSPAKSGGAGDSETRFLVKSHHVRLPNQQLATVIDLGNLLNVAMNNDEKTDIQHQQSDDGELQVASVGETDDVKTKYIYKCNVCGKEYNNKSNCHRHLKTHTHEKTYRCQYCSKSYMHRYELKMHMRIHTGEKPFKCPVCTRGFNEGGNLRRHMKIHAGDDTPYKCGVCFKGFSEMFRLQVHLKVHSGEIVCDTCGKKFGKISDLYRHIRIHTGDKPYKCDICGKSFCQKVNLQTHYRTHSGKSPYKCTICNFGFSRKQILDNHMRGHEPEEVEQHEYNMQMMAEDESIPIINIKEEPQTPAPVDMRDDDGGVDVNMENVQIDAKAGLVEVSEENQEMETGLSQEELAELVAATVNEDEQKNEQYNE